MDPLENLQDPTKMHFQFIFNLMQLYKNNIKFFDLRTSETFNHSHLQVALHVPIENFPITLDHLKTITKEKELSRLRRCCLILAYSSSHHQEFLQFKSLIESLRCKEVHILSDFDSFLSKYYFLCSNFRTLKIKEYPNEMIPNTLYLGSQLHAQSQEILDILQVTHILNVTRGPATLFPEIKYCRVSIEDSESEKISYFFQKAFEFIEQALIENSLGAKNVILVHCAKGVSRSPTIVVMFLMRSTGMNLDEAMGFVRRHRNFIEPNEGFLKELKEFESRHCAFVRRSYSLSRFHDCFEEEVKM